jgi:hypothetical protein
VNESYTFTQSGTFSISGDTLGADFKDGTAAMWDYCVLGNQMLLIPATLWSTPITEVGQLSLERQ